LESGKFDATLYRSPEVETLRSIFLQWMEVGTPQQHELAQSFFAKQQAIDKIHEGLAETSPAYLKALLNSVRRAKKNFTVTPDIVLALIWRRIT